MLCKKPFMIGIMPCPCSRCLPCLINRRRVWASRLILESFKHSDSCFATLTYDEASLPESASLVPKHAQDWLKRLRRVCEPRKIRFFLSGEYGTRTQRPHYHAALFGLDVFAAGGPDGCGGLVRDTWNYGHSFVGELNEKSASYVCGYVTKKYSKKVALDGRIPEFTRMSLRPGIGALAMDDVAKVLESKWGSELVERESDVPFALRQHMRSMPLGRYLRGRLRQAVGLGSKDTPVEAQRKYAETLRELCKEAFKDPSFTSKTFGKYLVDKSMGKINNMVARHKIFSSKEVL